MDDTRTLRFFNRGPSPAARLVFFSLLSLLLLFVDARYQYLESTRKVLAVIIYPVQRLTALPGETMGRIAVYFETQEHLLEENAQLRQQHDADAAQLTQLRAVQAEDEQLRTLQELKQRANYPMQMAEIAYVERDIFKRKLFVDKGSQANVQAGQVVVDDKGVVGQITRVYPWLSEVTLVTDKDHAVPIQLLRNGLRAVVFGSGDIGEMSLRYMPVSSDIVVGDVLVTSGIDGTYPPNLPVAQVVKIERDPAYPFARIVCVPLAGVDRHRALLIVSGLPQLAEHPAATETSDEPERARKRLKRRKQ
ncbi:cell shape-determining protein MreC [Sideroxyarcus emersonii]|uniref:Cell shape-determining protein MreC n=1 Tax=Sideroxyarcus emersonii TaxID=2764705 RepID=A0AAN1X7B1_9PROT|nr:rod shape-determining protein MreC [Sideroxyarcus emersonii]BCK86360.1 cell shape-determining protein MreC [Sideroxyarcus emersonii]